MFCESCGNQIRDGAIFCDRCGRQVAPLPAPPGPVPVPGPAPIPAPYSMAKQRSIAPFVLILVVYFLWFFWRTSGLNLVIFWRALRELPPEVASMYSDSVLPGLLREIIAIDFPHIVALAGLIAVLALAGQKKIDPRAFSWKDVVPMAVLCAVIPVSLLLLGDHVDHYYGTHAGTAFSVFWQIIRGPVPSALAVAGLWAACITFLLIRSGTLRVTRKKALICLGVALCAALVLMVYCSKAIQDYIDMVYGAMTDMMDVASIMEYALMITKVYCALLWIKWMALLWFAADSGSGQLPFWGGLIFAGVVILAAWYFCPNLLVALHPGLARVGLIIPFAFLLGAVVLLIFRLVRSPRRN